MRTEDFDYDLPKELIAQTPLADRSNSRLMVLNRRNHTIEHRQFKDIIDYLGADDVLVLNDTKVIPARLIGTKEDTGATIELLLLKDLGDDVWQCLAKPQRRLKVGSIISFGQGKLKGLCQAKSEMGLCEVKLLYEGILLEILNELGQMPLPPYIHEKLDNPNRYQTVYAKSYGSAAAPTAGLHFTKEILEQLQAKGVELVFITLHVGLGTFRPVEVEDVKTHKMHEEYYEISKEAASKLNAAINSGKRIVAVGTTSTRTLEAAYDGGFKPCCATTDIFIYPGYKFKVVQAQITNFHLPKSTLIMLVSAFAGKDFILNAYNEAVKERYRFFSFGDAMFIE